MYKLQMSVFHIPTYDQTLHTLNFTTRRTVQSPSSDSDVYWTVHHCDDWRIRNQLDATYYFIVLLIGSTCFGHYYAHHQALTTIMLITTLVVSFLVCCRLDVRCGYSLQPRHYSSLTAPNIQSTANQERDDQCGNQHYSRERLMMGIVVPETCWAYKQYNKIISGI